jgi:hypothetical protein
VPRDWAIVSSTGATRYGVVTINEKALEGQTYESVIAEWNAGKETKWKEPGGGSEYIAVVKEIALKNITVSTITADELGMVALEVAAATYWGYKRMP